MKRRPSFPPLLVGIATFYCASLEAAARDTAPKPPSSLEPDGKTAPVRISHRHRAIVECVRVPKQARCLGRVADGDSAAVVRFSRAAISTVAFEGPRAEPRAVFPHRAGPQEQVLDLPVGPWLVDWADSQKFERLDVRPGIRVHLALATTSGACELKADRCELLPGVRERHMSLSKAR